MPYKALYRAEKLHYSQKFNFFADFIRKKKNKNNQINKSVAQAAETQWPWISLPIAFKLIRTLQD